ncbi:MAG: hypothetical protein ACREUR_11800 [Nitrosospira sp.]
MRSGIQMAVIVKNITLMGLEVRRRIKGENMMFVIKLMRKYLAIKRPAKRIRQHTDKQHKHDGINMVAFMHVVRIVYPCGSPANVLFPLVFPAKRWIGIA